MVILVESALNLAVIGGGEGKGKGRGREEKLLTYMLQKAF